MFVLSGTTCIHSCCLGACYRCKIWASWENTSPPMVSQAGYEPDLRYFYLAGKTAQNMSASRTQRSGAAVCSTLLSEANHDDQNWGFPHSKFAPKTLHMAEVYRSRSVGVDSGRSLDDFRK